MSLLEMIITNEADILNNYSVLPTAVKEPMNEANFQNKVKEVGVLKEEQSEISESLSDILGTQA